MDILTELDGPVIGAVLEGKIWKLPVDADKPARKTRMTKKDISLLGRLKEEKEARLSGGIYHKIQVELTYRSNHIEGNNLSYNQVRDIYETNTISIEKNTINVDDIVETVNHFKCIDLVIDQANYKLSEAFIKQLHLILKSGTSDSNKSWFAVGEYKRIENEVGGHTTTPPEEVKYKIKSLLKEYNSIKEKTIEDTIEFHYKFERIHPFQDGNGRIGRLIMFKECLHYNITPFIIEDDLKAYYYRGLEKWRHEKGCLLDTYLTAQDRFKKYLDYYKINYKD